MTAGVERLLCVARLIAKALKPRRDLRLRAVGVRIGSGAQPVGRALEARLEIGLVGAFERVAQLLRGRRLSAIQLARGVAHVLLEVREIVGETLAIGGQLRKLCAIGRALP